MNLYTIHFFSALLLSELLLILFRKRNQPGWKMGLLIVPTLSYCVFYNYNLCLIKSAFIYGIGYLGSIWIFFCFCKLNHFYKMQSSFSDNEKKLKFVFLIIVQLVLFTFMCVFPWAVNTFPLSNVDAVLFTLFAPIDGSEEFVLQTFRDDVVVKGLIAFVIAEIALVLLCFLGTTYKRPRFNKAVFRQNIYFAQKALTIFLGGCVLINALVLPGIMQSEAFKALFEKSVDSELYKQNYISPQNSLHNASKKDKNLIVIFVESMSNSFSAYTPELNQWKNRGVEFQPGGVSVAGTSWTIAGITAAMCGLPLNMPMGMGEYLGKLPTYLPNAICMMDLLNEVGYNQGAVQGSSADFTQLRQFWKTHGNIDIVDNDVLKMTGKLDSNYRVFWGMEDKKTLAIAKDMLDSISALGKPFAYYLSTIDTHQPEGYLDSACHYNENTKYKNVLRCASSMLDDFLTWLSKKTWYDNSVVMVIGDHVMPPLAVKAGLSKNEEMRTASFFLNVYSDGFERNRSYTNLDYAPSILEALGWSLPKHGFGLGRSLFSKEPTMLEIYGKDSLNILLRQKSTQYNYFLYGR